MGNLNNCKFKCCGCSTCTHICPKHAITLCENDEGFKQFYIDESKCINCGLCIKKCPQINNIKNSKTISSKYYAAYLKNQNLIKKSASGGIFQAIANNFNKLGKYSIIGCKYDSNYNAIHDCVDDGESIKCFLSSKYVQSDLGDIYKTIKMKLKQDKYVLFSGTPCQVAGLYSFLEKKECEKLFTIDIICHGVPSPLLFKKYVDYLENSHKGKLKNYNFRCKDNNTSDKYYKYTIGKETYSDSYYFDSYYYNFVKGNNYRECCYECKYANKNRISDITIGDYLGINDVHPNIQNNLGVSVMIINTEKGEKIFDLIKKDIIYYDSEYEKASMHNHNLKSPAERPLIRNTIYNGIKEKTYDTLLKENFNYKIPLLVRLKLKSPKIMKKIYNELLKK